jgi:4-aminobutyrate aminotransferase-like enzyme
LAAVVTSRKVASTFEDCNVEYFNTFGGNPVSAAAGLAVLDVIRDEGLQRHGLEVGTYLKTKFQKLQETIEWIGDVRGAGLFLGVELVESKATLAPAVIVTSWLCSHLKQKYHILTSIDGPNNNVLVIKPPMVFSIADADYFVQSVEEALKVDLPTVGKLDGLGKTPT